MNELLTSISEQAFVLFTPKLLNLAFAGLCFAASRGACPQRVMELSAILYVGFAVCS